jgi:hypothetical protein
VTLKLQKTEHHVDASLNIPGQTLHAEASAQTMYAAIDLLADKLDRLVIKHKEKNSSTHRCRWRQWWLIATVPRRHALTDLLAAVQTQLCTATDRDSVLQAAAGLLACRQANAEQIYLNLCQREAWAAPRSATASPSPRPRADPGPPPRRPAATGHPGRFRRRRAGGPGVRDGRPRPLHPPAPDAAVRAGRAFPHRTSARPCAKPAMPGR